MDSTPDPPEGQLEAIVSIRACKSMDGRGLPTVLPRAIKDAFRRHITFGLRESEINYEVFHRGKYDFTMQATFLIPPLEAAVLQIYCERALRSLLRTERYPDLEFTATVAVRGTYTVKV